ncbi:MAG: AraC family transcriptional regulator [Verrucomicrobia bacterium]|nr:AraC family transcriptional regulator [Verrucomicrobiota bacterium]
MNEKSVYVFGNQIELPMLIHASRVRSHVASRVTWHSHLGFEMLFVLDGAAAYEFAGQSAVELHGGHFLVVPPGLVHRGLHNVRSPSTICGLALKASRPSAWKNSNFTTADVRRLRTVLENASRKVHPFNPALRWLVRRLMEETANYPANPHRAEAGIALRALISAVLVEAMRQILVPPTEPKVYVAAAIAYLRQHLHEPVGMADLVRHVGFSRARMFDLFKSQTGLTPNDYLQRMRIEKAQEQLRQTKLSVTEIGLANGFSSGQYFSTVFARYTGVSPTRFREGAKPNSRSPTRHAPR